MRRHAGEKSKGQKKTNYEKSTKYFGKASRERRKQHNRSCAAHARSLSESECTGCHSASFSNTPLTIGGGSNAYPSGCQKISLCPPELPLVRVTSVNTTKVTENSRKNCSVGIVFMSTFILRGV